MADFPSPVLPDEVSRRLAEFRRTQDPATLWPGLDEPRRVAAARAIESVARRVLAGERAVPLDPREEHRAYALGVAGHTTGMGPILGQWIEQGVVTAAEGPAAFFAEHLINGRSRAARIEREVLPAIDAFLARDVTPIILKGFHTARAYFDEPGARPMADVDLLVGASEVATAEQVLQSTGFRADSEALRPYKRDWLGPGVEDRVYSVERSDPRTKWTLELHASLDRIYHPGVVAHLDSERARTQRFDVAGRPLLVLAPALLVVYLAAHSSQELDSMRLIRIYELATVIRAERASGRLDWTDVIATLERTGAARFTYPALTLVEDLAPQTVDARVLAMARDASTAAARHTVPRLAPAGGSADERAVLRQMMWTRGVVGVLQRFLRLFWPAAFDRPGDVPRGWAVRLRRIRRGILSFRAPDERS
jgi:hypothetical protein